MTIVDAYKNLDLGLLSLEATAKIYQERNPEMCALIKNCQKKTRKAKWPTKK